MRNEKLHICSCHSMLIFLFILYDLLFPILSSIIEAKGAFAINQSKYLFIWHYQPIRSLPFGFASLICHFETVLLWKTPYLTLATIKFICNHKEDALSNSGERLNFACLCCQCRLIQLLNDTICDQLNILSALHKAENFIPLEHDELNIYRYEACCSCLSFCWKHAWKKLAVYVAPGVLEELL